MNSAEATREVLWNISHGWVMYVLLVPTTLIGCYGVWIRCKSWKQGLPAEGRLDNPGRRLKYLWNHALLQRRNLHQKYAGIFHAMIFWGFITLTIATTVVMIDHDFGIPIMRGAFYLYFQSLFVDILGLLALIGVALAGYRRWKSKPKKLVYTDEASWILIVAGVILASEADTVAAGCPFCTTMMEDGINATKGERQLEVKELAELLNEATDAPPETHSTNQLL